jgi:hypothetical protein
MADVPQSPVSSDQSEREIRDLLEQILRQNIMLRRYICVLGAGVALSLLLQLDLINTVVQYAVIVAIIMAVLLTAPWWSQVIVGVTDRIPWYPKRRRDRRDSATGPV